MTHQVLTAEAIEAAETAYYETLTELRLQEGGGFKVASQVKRSIRAALEAAVPHMLAVALDEGDEAWDRNRVAIGANPFKSEA